jgi:hypothetical protein
LTEAQSTVDSRRSAAKEFARNGASDSELDKAESQLRISQDRVNTLTAALAETIAEVATLEAEHAALLDKQVRAETAAKIEADAAKLIAAAKLFDEGAKALSGIAADISTYILDAKGLEVFCASAAMETPPAVDLLSTVMKSFAQSVIHGHAAATLPKPAPPSAPIPQPEPLAALFSLRPIAWTAHDGTLCTEHKWFDVQLPPAAAARALRVNAACNMSNPIRAKQKGFGKTTTKPKIFDCVNLDIDAQPDPQVAPPTIHSAFETPVVGKPFVVSTARGNSLPATASRSLGKEDKS